MPSISNMHTCACCQSKAQGRYMCISEFAGLVAEYAGLGGEYAGLSGEYAGLVGEYAALIGKP